MTLFLRLLDVPVDGKQEALLTAIKDRGPRAFNVDPNLFGIVPGSAFSYWAGARVLDLFRAMPNFADSAEAWVGLQTNYDFRWLRCWWEGPLESSASESMAPFAKGGTFSPYYADIYLTVKWSNDGYQIKQWKIDQLRQSLITANNSRCWNESHYFRPGLTWPRRTNGLSFRVLPAGCIFGDKGPGIFDRADSQEHLLALCAIVNSKAFGHLVSIQLARTELAQSYEVGLIQRTPVPKLSAIDQSKLALLARRAWSLKRSVDTRVETSRAYLLPALLQVDGKNLAQRAESWTDSVSSRLANLTDIRAEIDAICFALYNFDESDQQIVNPGIASGVAEHFNAESIRDASAEGDADSDADTDLDGESGLTTDALTLAAELISWAVGIAFGRFDIRVATGARSTPAEPEPFDTLSPCSPAMLAGDDGRALAVAPPEYPIGIPDGGILVDDLGHARDLASSVRAIFDKVFKESSEAWWNDVAALLDPKDHDLNAWISSGFFDLHLKSHSKSRRRVPVFWHFAVPSRRYGIWLYAQYLTRDSFFQIQNDVVTPKLAHEERQLASLVQIAGGNPSATERKEIAEKEGLVFELRSFLEEIKRVAPLWNPMLDDGVVLTMAPLWRLVPQHKLWQKELRTKWVELGAGKYDWSNIAMHLWPERVVPRCATDRSFAIAHGLENNFWLIGDDGKWCPRSTPTRSIDELVRERTSAAVKTARNELIDASAPAGPKTRARRSSS